MKILLTGFDPFGTETVNPALLAVDQVRAPQGVELVKLEVPTKFHLSAQVVAQAMEREHPDAVVCIGQAGGRNAITPERVAINLMDATMADNAGFTPVDEPVIPGGEAAFFSTLPVKAIVQALKDAKIPAALSNTAGTFVCNQLMYQVLWLCKHQYPGTRAGFIHVPFLPEQVAQRPEYPSLPLDTIVAGLELALTAIAVN